MSDPTYHESPLFSLFERSLTEMSLSELNAHITSLREIRANPVQLRMKLLDEADHGQAIAKKTARKRKGAPVDASAFI